MDRKQFLRSATLGVGTLALGPVTALLEGGEPTPIPIRVGATEIEQIRTATQVFESWDSTYGGGLGREAVLAQLRWSAGLLDAACPARLRTELFRAVGDLADLAAFMAFDAYAHDEARRVFRFALACAEQADDWHLRAQVLGNTALQAIWTRAARRRTHPDRARPGPGRPAHPTERAMLHTYTAARWPRCGWSARR